MVFVKRIAVGEKAVVLRVASLRGIGVPTFYVLLTVHERLLGWWRK